MKYENSEKEYGTIVAGRNPVLEILNGTSQIEKIYLQRGEREGSIKKIYSEAKKKGILISEVDKSKLDNMAGGTLHQGVIAVIVEKEYSSIDEILDYAKEINEKPLIVICDEIEDPHNIGAIIRSAECAGAHGVVLSKRHCPSLNTTIYKTSAGAVETMKIARVTNIANTIDDLKDKGIWVFGADMDGESYSKVDFNCPVALVMGNEGKGISRLVRDKCDYIVSIPMKGTIDSLNVSSATAILLFKILENRE